jgi:serine/threonine protein kinase
MLDIGRTVGQYEILREIGRGGMATVYLARQRRLDRFVALKELKPADRDDATFARRFLREARVAAELSHPSIVTVYEYLEHEGTPFIAMEYVPRGSLRPWIGQMTLAQIAGVLESVLAGLAHGEEHGIVHRDLKPENVMVTAEGRVKIADYGIAKATRQARAVSATLTAVGTTVGTPAYMAPEQAMGQEVSAATDLYSLGCMTYEMVTGRPPFDDSDGPMALLLRHVNEPVPPARALDPAVDPAVSDWIDRLLVKDPERRTRTATQAWDELEEIVLRLLGPRWRREARLTEPRRPAATPVPLTPAPFARPQAEAEESGFVTYAPPPPSRPPTHESEVVPEAFELGPPVPPASAPRAPAAPAPPAGAPAAPAPRASAPAAPVPRVSAPAAPAPRASAPAAPVPPASAPAAPVPPAGVPSAPVPPAGAPSAPVPPASAPPAPAPPASAPPAPAPVAPPPVVPSASVPVPEPEPAATLPVSPPAAAALPPPPRPPAAAGRPRRPRRRRRLLLAVPAAAILAGVAALVLLGGGEGGAPAPPVPSATLTSGPATLTLPAGWSALPQVPSVAGLSLGRPVAAAPGGRPSAGSLVLGLAGASADRPSLLPSELRGALGIRPTATPPRATARLAGAIAAYRYDRLGSRPPLTVYAVPTSAGVVTIAAIGPAGQAAAFDQAVAGAARTLRILGADVYPLGPDRAYARALDRALATLQARTRGGARSLRAARTARSQAGALAAIAAAYGQAADTVRALAPGPAVRVVGARLLRSLRDARAAYAELAAAARGERAAAYRQASRLAQRRTRTARRALRALRENGYAALVPHTIAAVRVPSLRRTAAPAATPSATATPAPTATAAPTAPATPQQNPAPAPTATATPRPDGGGGGGGGGGGAGSG